MVKINKNPLHNYYVDRQLPRGYLNLNKTHFPKIPFSFATNPKDGAEAAVPIGKAVAACEAVPRRKGAEKEPWPVQD